MSTNTEQIAAQLAPDVSRELQLAAEAGGNEAEFRRRVARILEETGARCSLQIVPRDEFSVARGRVDSVYNRLILEYKRPGVLRNSNKHRPNQEVIQQVKDYILDVGKRERRESHRLAGVATDGSFFIFVRRVGEGWTVDDPMPVNPSSTETFLRLLFSLCTGAALVPENLVQDFGPKTIHAQRAVRALYTALHSSKHPLVAKLFEQWRLFFSEATDYSEWSARIESKEEFRTFVRGMGLDPQYTEAARVFFALHTYYALLIKLVASLAAARFAGGESAPLARLAGKTGEALKAEFTDLERGGLFREYGIRNFLEGDFFGWYLAAWDSDIETALRSLVLRLAEYDPGTLELAPENARDLLKKLYHYLLPREIRHDLGEYYTPDWLAERLIRQTLGERDLGDATKRVMDPSCGSGTFLVILIKYIRERAAHEQLDPRHTLTLILQNVIGIDLNPLAVIAARTNYLLALGDLLKSRKGDIDIPVYQADSVLTPSQGSDLFDGNVYPLKTSVGPFRVPAIFAHRERMDALANVLDDCVESRVSENAFLQQLLRATKIETKELKASESDLKTLYLRLRELHDQGLNGVWARIIKNAFAPLFLEPCDYIVGNPPWVNWEHLPDDYRNGLIPLYESKYELFKHRGLSDRHGSAKVDISTLLTYVAGDKYLRAHGKLGFIIPQGFFKTADAGKGFRRFILPDKIPFGPIVVEDMSEIQPFEGATNRTAVLVMGKGHRVRYPVPYQYWKKRGVGRGSGIAFDTPYEEVTSNKITASQWFAEPVASNDPTSPWLTARRQALRAIRKFLGVSPYVAHEGANTGGANAVFWVTVVGKRPGGTLMVSNITEGARREVQQVQAAVEAELVYPLLRGRDVQRWSAQPSASILVPQNPERPAFAILEDKMQAEFPKAYSYFKRFAKALGERKSQVIKNLADKQGFYFLYSVKEYTLAPFKVVWREQAFPLTVAVVGPEDRRPVVPDHKLMMVDATTSSEAHYLCAVLNSTPARFAVAAYAVEIQTGVHVLKNIAVPKFDTNQKIDRELADRSKRAHEAVAAGHIAEMKRIESEIDKLVSNLWGISESELSDLKTSLEEM